MALFRARQAWSLALIPLALSIVGLVVSPRPPSDALLELPVRWRTAPGAAPEWRALDFDDREWPEVKLPSAQRGLVERYVDTPATFRGTFAVPSSVDPGKKLFLVCDCVGAVIVNGKAVGTWDPYRRGPRLGVGHGGLAGFSIPSGLLRPEGNVIALEVFRPPRSLMLGTGAGLEPYFTRLTDLKRALTLGPNFLLLLLTVLFWRLGTLHDDPKYKRMYRSAVLLALGSAVLADLKLGLVQTMPESNLWTQRYYFLLVCLATVYYYEFFEDYFLERTTRFRVVNRVVTLAFAAASLQLHVHALWTYYALGVMAWCLTMLLTSPRLRDQLFGPMLGSVYVCWMGAQVLGMFLPDLHARTVLSPDATLGLIVSAVVLADFLNVYSRTRALSASLGQANSELAEALAQATEAARLKGEFVANVSHELRTPLNAIINVPAGILGMFRHANAATCGKCGEQFELEAGEAINPTTFCPECKVAGTLKEGQSLVLDGSPEEMVKHLRLIERSGVHLLNVVNDILDFSKLDAGKMNLVVETFSVEELVQHVAETLKPLTVPRRIQIQVASAAERVEIKADRVKCAQVLINLVGNAIKFSAEGSTVKVGFAREESNVRITVQDSGIGLSPEQAAYIFEPFRQAEGNEPRRFGGTGLGLSIAKQIVDLHHGRIVVESEVGKGSTFSVVLPLHQNEEPEPVRSPAHHESSERASGQRIVVAEDDPVVVETIRLALRSLEVHVVGVEDPRQLLATLEREQPAAVILDVMMPRVSGLDLLKQIRADPRFQDLPILVSSAFDDNAEVARGMGASFISKPWRKDRLVEHVRRMLGRDATEMKAVSNA